jgi:hypothetical protein
VTCGSSAGLTDPLAFVCEDLSRVKGDPLLSACRRSLRKLYGFEEGKPMRNKQGKMNKPPRKWKITAVYSTEPQKDLPEGSDASSMRRCDGPLGTGVFVTGTSGFGTFHSSVVMSGMSFLDGFHLTLYFLLFISVAAGQIVSMIANDKLIAPRNFKGNLEGNLEDNLGNLEGNLEGNLPRISNLN